MCEEQATSHLADFLLAGSRGHQRISSTFTTSWYSGFSGNLASLFFSPTSALGSTGTPASIWSNDSL